MLELHTITKSYTTANFTQKALDGVSVAFRDNEFVAILGQSGSGKTTMLNVIGGLDHFDEGDLVIDGISTKNFKARDWDAYRNNRIGFVFQAYNLIPHQSVLANVELALTLSGVSRTERRERALEALRSVGLQDHVSKKPSQLSGGQMQRVAIARALINDPEIVLADEPTGALDSATSVQVMDLLRDVARDRLVIMVTHNPELAEQYATRTVELADGHILSDSDPWQPSAAHTHEAKPARKTRMGPLTALALSFTNLMTKKGRTLMTSFAGSIGIIGIAAILALANGVNEYIARTEEETLTSYPLSIQQTGMSMESMVGVASTTGTQAKPGQVPTYDKLTKRLTSASKNDLKSLKAFFDANGGGINSHVRAIEYSIDITPQIYQVDTSKGVYQVHPEQALSPMSKTPGADSSSAGMGGMFALNAFSQLPTNPALYEPQYQVLAGHWPTNDSELVLVLDNTGSMMDLYEYTMGLRPHDELDDMFGSMMNGEAVDPKVREKAIAGAGKTYTYNQILGREFSRVNAFERYEHEEKQNVWTDRSDDEDYMRGKVAKGQRLTITGIVKAKEDGPTALQPGIAYTPGLTQRVITEAAQSEIVFQQRKHPDIDVFSGRSFDDIKNGTGNPEFDMTSLFTIDESKLQTAFTIDQSKLQMDMSSLDFSSMDMSSLKPGSMDLSQMDMSGLDPSALKVDLRGLDPSQLDLASLTARYPQLGQINFPAVIEKSLQDGAIKPGAGAYVSGRATELLAGYNTYWATKADTNADGIPDKEPGAAALEYLATDEAQAIIQDIASSDQVVDQAILQKNLAAALGEDPALQSISSDVSSTLANSLMTEISRQLSAQISQQISHVVSQYIESMMSQVMQQFMTELQAQIRTQLEKAMRDFATQIPKAMKVDPDKFAEAFTMDMSKEEMTALLSTMFAPRATSAESNLEKLGWADPSVPTAIKIYPKSFEDKDAVQDIIAHYNDAQKEAGHENRVITYADLVGLLMSSVTSIINVITWMLIAFVSISLVVSSIMIAIITYISVLERKKEIGILRAIGASKADVRHVFNAETVIIGLLAGLLGVGITVALTIPANLIVEKQFDVANIATLPPLAGVILVAISVVLTVAAGLLPSGKAARQDPVEALRAE